ncbi:hypothetical protein BJ170DRAFT_229500 [Xylariales sp. AK1849]|nr:hypothetical protein BJ170DRAFT_229500 [Xylariales sp. AK1849]
MATRYSVVDLLHLRDSPLCIKPNTLPPAEEWMGPPPETLNGGNRQGTGRTGTDRTRNNDNSLLDQTNRRPGLDRHVSRNSASGSPSLPYPLPDADLTIDPEDIILGPPRTAFSSSTLSRGSKPFDNDKAFKESDARDRFATFRRNGDGDTERFRDSDRTRERGDRTNFRRRGEADQDSDGWSTVKPRKSFGHEGAERFHRPDRFGGSGGGGGDRGGERRPRDNHQEDNGDRPRRSNFGEFSRDQEGDEGERPRRNGLNRNRSDQPSWARGNNGDDEPPPTRERFDRAKSWRERDRDQQHGDDKPRDRNADRRWDRDQRQEREPEWLDEPAEDKPQGHTVEDFQKFMETMKASKNADAKPEQPTAIDTSARVSVFEAEKPKLKSAPAIERGPDKFFANFAPTPSADVSKPLETPKESAPAKAKTGSRFQNFFSNAQEDRRTTEPPTPAVAPPPPPQEPNPLLAFANLGANAGHGAGPGNQPDTTERVAFQALLQKLHIGKQSLTGNTPPSGGFPAPPGLNMGSKEPVASPGSFPPFGQERRDEPVHRGPPMMSQEMHVPRPQQQNNQLPPIRTEQQVLQELIGQRYPMPNQVSGRADQSQSRNSNSNAEFLMTLMQSARNVPGPPRAEEHIRMPQPSRPAQIPQTQEREQDYQRERSSSQHQGRPQGLPSFFDETQLHHHEQDNRRQQPTQILQRQGPPGLDQMHPNWMQGGSQQLPPGPGRPMIPPPGLAGNPRINPMPGVFPPNFPMGGFPPEGMAGPPPRNMVPPPGFFGGGPPPGFMPPPGMGAGFHHGPQEALAFGFDGRGMPPPGAGGFRRN